MKTMKGRGAARLALCLCLASVLAGPLGCSSHKKIRTETTESSSDPAARSQYRHEEVRTEESDNSSGGCSGVLSCAVDVVGEIIAFPFKAVGVLSSAIF